MIDFNESMDAETGPATILKRAAARTSAMFNPAVRGAALCALVFLSGCRTAPPASPPTSDTLVVLSDAIDVRTTDENDGGVVYRVHDPYPAVRSIREISEQLERRGWAPLEYDPLNPNSASSRVTGWGSYRDLDGTSIHQWMASWRDPGGNVVTYGFYYRGNPEHLQPLVEVRAAFLRAETVEILKSIGS